MASTARKIALCVLIIAAVIWVGFIFSNSLDNGTDSGNKSATVTATINKATQSIGIEKEITESVVRDMAHFSEFAVLSVLLCAIIAVAFFHRLQNNLPFSLLCIAASVPACFILACADEFLQKFSDGRASQITDALLDTLGAICGYALFIIGYLFFTRIFQKSRRS